MFRNDFTKRIIDESLNDIYLPMHIERYEMKIEKIEALIADVDRQMLGRITRSKQQKLRLRRSNLMKALESAKFHEMVEGIEKDE